MMARELPFTLVPRNDVEVPMKIQCCVCYKIRSGDEWRRSRRGELNGERVSSTYCRPCALRARNELREERAAWEMMGALHTP